MLPVMPNSLSELLNAIGKQATHPGCVWRGQSNFVWPCFPSLYRRLLKSGYADSVIDETLVRRAETIVIQEACKQSLLDAGDEATVGFMARVQHYGGATRLLDVSYNPLVALYFSLSNKDQTGVVYRYLISSECTVSADDGLVLWRDLLAKGESGRPVLYNPLPWDRRIEVQEGAFLTTSLPGFLSDPTIFTNQTLDSEVDVIWVNPRLKNEARAYLEEKGITQQALFPSMQDFAKSQSFEKSFIAGV